VRNSPHDTIVADRRVYWEGIETSSLPRRLRKTQTVKTCTNVDTLCSGKDVNELKMKSVSDIMIYQRIIPVLRDQYINSRTTRIMPPLLPGTGMS
jgi:hypothetical protein